MQNFSDVSLSDKDKNTSLHFAAEFCDFEIVKLLIEHSKFGKSYINVKNKNNDTALDVAKNGKADVVTLLRTFLKQSEIFGENEVNISNNLKLHKFSLWNDFTAIDDLLQVSVRHRIMPF